MFTLYTGPMWSGKTSEVIRELSILEVLGKKCMMIKHKLDTNRYNQKLVSSHGTKSKARIEWTGETMVVERLEDVVIDGHMVIGIDELQFYSDSVEYVNLWVDQGILVYGAMLDSTWQCKPFGRIGELHAMSDKCIKLRGRCNCGKRSSFTVNILPLDQRTEIAEGAEEKYKSVCRKCRDKHNQLYSLSSSV